MNQVLEAILDRRSIRKYKTEPIAQELMDQILEAGFYAPSAHNRQPQHFVVVEDREILGKIREVHRYTKFLDHAPCAIIVCGDTAKSEVFWTDDCAASTQNILLAAHALGLGSCWCAVEHAPWSAAIGEFLDLPETVKPYSLIALGHPDETRPRPAKGGPDRVHRNRW